MCLCVSFVFVVRLCFAQHEYGLCGFHEDELRVSDLDPVGLLRACVTQGRLDVGVGQERDRTVRNVSDVAKRVKVLVHAKNTGAVQAGVHRGLHSARRHQRSQRRDQHRCFLCDLREPQLLLVCELVVCDPVLQVAGLSNLIAADENTKELQQQRRNNGNTQQTEALT